MAMLRMACAAMATRFELVLHGPEERRLRALGEEAVGEIERIEAALSLYRPDSQVSAVNRRAARQPVRVTPEVFQLIEHACLLSRVTDGAFDVTVAPLVRVWGGMGERGRVPEADEIEAARRCVGWDGIDLDPDRHTIGFRCEGMMLDLGSIGKGYALDRAAEGLRDGGIEAALIHGGTSTAVAWGSPPEIGVWRVAIDPPQGPGCPGVERAGSESGAKPLAVVDLRDETLSVSAVWGKGFEAGGRYYGHVIDPRLGEPVQGAWLAAAVLPSATESDALSTALLVRGAGMLDRIGRAMSVFRGMVVEAGGGVRSLNLTMEA
ncbi:MAG: FAD:protein FMN transferase [Verrucomicrobiae bacterium]|nr:FAD:protein FMN transferase [Verrucomicrobiae bacterium]